MTDYRIPFNRATQVGTELELVQEAFARGNLAGAGPFTQACQALLQETLGVPKVLLTTSCTDALELSALLLDLVPGDEVIMPSFTFVSTANAFALRGAKPVFGDVRPDTLNLDESKIEALITPRTKAIVVVHYAGVACAMDEIVAIAERHGLPVIEDAAHALFGDYKDRPLGTIGQLATLSFHETKNFTSGEGGALLINDPALIERAEILWQKGTDRSRFYRGEVDKYTWVDLGSSFTPSEINAAVLLAQLRAREVIQRKRREAWTRYAEGLRDWARETGTILPTVPAGCDQAYHLFYLLLRSESDRARLIKVLREAGIVAVFHYQPLHLSAMGERYGGQAGDCPVTEDVSERLLRLPFFTDISEEQQREVIAIVREFRPAD